VVTNVPGVFAAGSCTGPADLEDSVSMGGAAAIKAATLLRRAAMAATAATEARAGT
jgi:heterodisulfide reductase subunit A2